MIEPTTPSSLKGSIRALQRRVEFRRNKYNDHVGALFFLNLCEGKDGPDKVSDFMTRFAAQGYNIELNDDESEALRKAGEATNLANRVMGVPLRRNIQSNLLNTRRAVLLGGGAIGLVWILEGGRTKLEGVALREAGDFLNQQAQHPESPPARLPKKQDLVDEINRDMAKDQANEIVAQASDGHGHIGEKKLADLLKKKLDQQNKEVAEGAHLVGGWIEAGVLGITAALYLLKLFEESRRESRAKGERVLATLDEFCESRLNRLPYPPRAGEGRT